VLVYVAVCTIDISRLPETRAFIIIVDFEVV
jgi:hypothetical protein